MSIVEGIAPRATGLLPNRPRRAGEARFTLDTAPQPARASAAEAPMPAIAAGMLALQEAAVEAPQDRAARRHGRAMLAVLSRLQCILLSGADSEAALDELAMRAAISHVQAIRPRRGTACSGVARAGGTGAARTLNDARSLQLIETCACGLGSDARARL